MRFNKYNWKEFGKKVILSTIDGSILIISKEEFKQFNERNIGEKLKQKLIEKNIIITQENIQNIQENLIKRFHFIVNDPTLHIIVLSNRCTHKCTYCHAASVHSSKSEYDMSIETANKVIETILSAKTNELMIEFQGGEPLINFECLQHIIESINEKKGNKKIRFGITTNLEVMNDEILDYLISHKVQICTSLDGSESLHNLHRKTENKEFNSYKNIEKWIKKIKSRDYDISALVTVTRDSLDKWKEIIDTYVKLGFKNIFLRPLNNLGSAKSKYDIGYSADEYFQFYKNSVEYIKKLRKKGIDIFETYTEIMLRKLINDYDPNLCELRNPSGDCTGVLTYNHDGKIYPRDEGRMEATDIDLFTVGQAGESISKIMRKKKVKSMIESTVNLNYDCSLCVYQAHCGLNPVSNYSNYNSITPINIEDERCKLLQLQFDFLLKKLNSYPKI